MHNSYFIALIQQPVSDFTSREVTNFIFDFICNGQTPETDSVRRVYSMTRYLEFRGGVQHEISQYKRYKANSQTLEDKLEMLIVFR